MSKFQYKIAAGNKIGNGKGSKVDQAKDKMEEFAQAISDSCDVEPLPTQEQLENLLDDEQLFYDPESGETQTTVSGDATTPISNYSLVSAGSPSLVADEKINSQFPEELSTEFEEAIDSARKNLIGTIETIDEISSEPLVRSQGKTELYVAPNIVGSSLQDFKDTNFLRDNNVFVVDSFRSRLGSFWTTSQQNKKIKLAKKEAQKNLIETRKIAKEFVSKSEQMRLIDPEASLGVMREALLTSFNRDRFRTSNNVFSPGLLESFLVGRQFDGSIKDIGQIDFPFYPTFSLNVPFEDLVFSFDKPYSKKEAENIQLPVGVLSANVKSDYNFYIRAYEDLMNSQDVKENVLPNMYVLLTQRNSKEPNQAFKQIINLKDKIDLNGKDPGLGSIRETSGQYYNLFSQGYRQSTTTDLEQISQKMENLVISHKDLGLLKNYNSDKELFPMNVKVEFQTDKLSKFGQILKETDLLDTFIGKVINSITQETNLSQIDFIKQITALDDDNGQANFSTKTEVTSTSNRVWDITSLLGEIEQDKKLDTLQPNVIYLGEQENYRSSLDNESNRFFNSLRIAILKNKAITFVKNNLRSFSEIIEGKKCYSETLLYRIAKYKGKQITNISRPIQNIYVPNDSELDVLSYIDTQVKYEQDYTYVVYAYEMVLANTYSYYRVEDSIIDSDRIIGVVNTPAIKLVETAFYTHSTNVSDLPPSPPEVSMAPYKDEPNKLLVMLNGSINDFKAVPVILDEKDEEKFEKARKSQDIEEGRAIRFGGDDFINNFEVYRIDRKPASYLDFKGSKKATLSTSFRNYKSNSVSFVDSISSNKKYYYMFRCMDVHGNISNPTKVVEVEIINENGTIYPLINNVEFQEAKNYTTTKSVKRLLHIRPSILQTLLNEDNLPEGIESAEEIKNTVMLGYGTEKIWNKKVKIRLTSRNTKKIIDFDVQFKHQNQDLVEN